MSARAVILAFEALPKRQQIIVAAKIGAWAEFLGERIYKYVKPKVFKVYKAFIRRRQSKAYRRPISRHRVFHRNSPNIIYR